MIGGEVGFLNLKLPIKTILKRCWSAYGYGSVRLSALSPTKSRGDAAAIWFRWPMLLKELSYTGIS